MKKLLLLLCLFAAGSAVSAQQDSTATTATVYIIRETGHAGGAVNFRVVVDDLQTCKIRNNRFSIIRLQPGTHNFFVTTWDAPNKKDKLGLEVPLEAGKTYYLRMIQKQRFVGIHLYFEEITKNSALPLLQKMKEDTDCSK